VNKKLFIFFFLITKNLNDDINRRYDFAYDFALFSVHCKSFQCVFSLFRRKKNKIYKKLYSKLLKKKLSLQQKQKINEQCLCYKVGKLKILHVVTRGGLAI
jgi:hypothetical protein